ncbi:SDR family oxidoreductase [Maribellus maritimus]|uniref:SDR family oxidoreductase n=1 Tax=Maribellus maritimus TaxID=2870838 RepID=UPI001EEBAD94|nr:SDR family oxidoreductase [Maribellus maritimus]MCG6190584.1 SDR family oxidoreductase [Maribellus maritimus]
MQNKVVVITGASSGIGKALAQKYAAEGWDLVLAARRIERLHALEREFKNTNILSVKTDVSLVEDCRDLIDKAIGRFGKIDVLINNAGISMRAIFENVELPVLHRMMDVNFWGTVYCTKFALPYLLESKGSLVGVISVGGYLGLPGRTGYSASKFAVRGFLDTVRVENRRSGLHVLVAAPGFTTSEIRKSALVADGRQQGETPRNENKMMSAEECAGHIYRAVKRRRRKIILTVVEGKLTVFMAKMWADLVDGVMYRMFASEPDSPLR